MKMQFKRLMALCLCLAIVLTLFPVIAPVTEANAALYNKYTTIAKVTTQGGCNAMQGMDVDGTYIYCAKINSETEKTCSIARVHKTTGEIVYLKNSATGTNYFSQLAHANDLGVCTVNSVKTMFVGTGGAGKGDYSLVRFSFNGTTLTEVGHYNMKYNGAEKYIAGVKAVATSPTEITLVLKSGNYVYAAKIPYNSTGGDIAMEYLGKLDFSAVNFGGTIRDLSNYVVQGFGYKDNKLFVPMTANYQTSTSHISTIVCFDIDGVKGGNLKPDSSMSVWIEDTTYPDLFEIESCAICPTDGKLYFGTNCRKTSSDGNHDSVHVLNGFVYDPIMGDLTTGQNYHFRPSSGKLKSVTTGAAVFNSVLQHLGTVSNGNKISGARWSMDMPMILKHTDPWIITWESSNWTTNSLMLSTYDTSSFANNYYLYRRSGSGLIALGYYGNSQYNNYGVDLSAHGIDDTVNHTYQLKNQVNADGTNMVYLWVDGTNLGAMNNYYAGATSQNKTSNWVSGKDFCFSYIGTPQHPVSCTMQYLKVWTKGNINAFDEPSVFRWETQNNKMTSISQFGYTNNAVTDLGGSCTDGTYSSYYNRLLHPVVLMHDRPWVVEWKTPSWTGNTMLFSSGDTALKLNASYLYRSNDIVALGYCDGAKCHSYGIKLADHGLSASGGYTYRLTNKINADGTNMVYLSIDGQELGPMNRYYLGSEYQNQDVNWVSGKDYTFSHMGNYNYGLNQAYDYIQVWENGIPSAHQSNRYRWEASGSSFKNITTGDFTANKANRVVGSISGGKFDEATYRLNTPIVLQHDQEWTFSWRSSGSWAGSAGGGFLFSSSLVNGEVNAPYLYRRKESGMIGIGIYNGSKHMQYGLQLSDFGIDGTADHTYTLSNRLNSDGSNMIYLSVDGQELGAMNNYFVGAAAQGTTGNWLSGKDFTFTYLGTPRFPLSNVTVHYLEVDEGGHAHSYGPWTVTTAATCTDNGSRSHSCSECGHTETETIVATGHSYQSTTVAPDCSNGGYTVFTCAACGDTYYGASTEATGHDYRATVIAPTCNTGGYTTYTCSLCGHSYQGNATEPIGHDYRAVVTAPTCLDGGYTVYTCNVCGNSYSGGYTNATGHSYKPTVIAPSCTTSGYTSYNCTSCGHSYTDLITDATGHSYANGSCIYCGMEDPNHGPAVVQPTLTLKSPTLEFKDMICIVAFYTAENLQDVVDMGMITYSSEVDSWSVETAEYVIPGYDYDAATGRYYSGSQGIHAKYLADTVYLAVYAKLNDGSYVYSKLAAYSAVTYADSQLKNASSTALKQLVVAMLNYGAQAQLYFGHNTSDLANAALTADQLALPETYRSNMVSTVPAVSAVKQGSFANNQGFASRIPSISFEGAFSINYFFTPKYVPQNGITLYYWNSSDYDAASVLTIVNASGSMKLEGNGTGQYRGDLTGIAAKKLSDAVYVAAVYEHGGTTWTSGVLGYSIGAYCSSQAAKGGNVADLAMATAVYGYHAKQYFG